MWDAELERLPGGGACSSVVVAPPLVGAVLDINDGDSNSTPKVPKITQRSQSTQKSGQYTARNFVRRAAQSLDFVPQASTRRWYWRLFLSAWIYQTPLNSAKGRS